MFSPIAWPHRKHYGNRVIFPRRSGILLHVTSLPGIHGIGDFGDSAYEFIEFLAGSGQKIWQVLPLNPTGYGDSPYQCFSAFAGNPLFINLDALREDGLLSAQDLWPIAPDFPDEHVAYDQVIAFKQELLRKAARTFFADSSRGRPSCLRYLLPEAHGMAGGLCALHGMQKSPQ